MAARASAGQVQRAPLVVAGLLACACLFLWAPLRRENAANVTMLALGSSQENGSANCHAAAAAAAATAPAAAAATVSQASAGPDKVSSIPPDERSYYAKWIDEDLSHWKETGITEQMVDHAVALGLLCDPAILRFQIINGSLYIDGVEPGRAWGYNFVIMKNGWPSGNGRPMWFLLSLLETLRVFPGQIPDVDAVMQLGDFPCITEKGTTFHGRTKSPPWIKTQINPDEAVKEAEQAGYTTPEQRAAAAAPPILAYNSRKGYRDIPFPDYTFFFRETGVIMEGKGFVQGWDAQLAHYKAEWDTVPLEQRYPQLIWRGRTQEARDTLRRTFVGCDKYLANKGVKGVINLWENWGFKGINLHTVCMWRFNAYLESFAWSSSFQRKFACGNIIMTPVMEYYEFFTRAMEPGVHFIEVSRKPGEMCEDIARNVKAMNSWLDQLREAKKNGQPFPPEEKPAEAGQQPAPEAQPAEAGNPAAEEKPAEAGQQPAPEAQPAEAGQPTEQGKPAEAGQQPTQAEAAAAAGELGNSTEAAQPGAVGGKSAGETGAGGVEQPAAAGGVQPQTAVEPVPQQQQQEQHPQQQQRRRLAEEEYGFPPKKVYGHPVQKARDKYKHPWDSDLLPTELAQNAQQFIMDHVRMRDVMLYIRDLLQQYAKLQRFTPRVQPKSVHFEGVVLKNYK